MKLSISYGEKEKMKVCLFFEEGLFFLFVLTKSVSSEQWLSVYLKDFSFPKGNTTFVKDFLSSAHPIGSGTFQAFRE